MITCFIFDYLVAMPARNQQAREEGKKRVTGAGRVFEVQNKKNVRAALLVWTRAGREGGGLDVRC